jgi:proline iminopeptidase
MCAHLQSGSPSPRVGYLPAGDARLYYREIGSGQPVVVLHGGPDFSQSYLLPDMDLLASSYRLIYYDQRGRGKSAANVQPEDVTMQSEVRDLEALRSHFHLESLAVLGHSWGGLLAMEYAIRHPNRVSHLILMNTAPASREDYMLFKEARRDSAPADIETLTAMSSTAPYIDGDPDTVADYYRIHFRATLRKPEHLEQVIRSLRSSFTREGILQAWAIEDRLMNETWLSDNYDLFPVLKQLSIPTLIIHGEHDFVPVECAAHIAQSIPGARLKVVAECGHFTYLECPEQVHEAIDGFFRGNRA